MAPRIIIFHEIFTILPDLETLTREKGVETELVAGGKEVLSKLSGPGPKVIIVDAAMPQMSGIECCRQIKEGSLDPVPIVVVVSSIDSPAIAQRAKDAGADLFVLKNEAGRMIPRYLRDVLEGKVAASGGFVDAEKPLVARPGRIAVSGQIVFSFENQEYRGVVINASASGVLFASDATMPMGTRLTLRFSSRSGETYEFSTEAIRTIELKEPYENFPKAIGARFVDLKEEDRELLDDILAAARARSKAQAPEIDATFVRNFLGISTDAIRVVALGGEGDEKVKKILGELPPFERQAFTVETPVAACVQRMVLLRSQCDAYRLFVPSIQADRGALAALFLPMLAHLLKKADEIDQEVEGLVREAVAQGNSSDRQGLNEMSTRLYEAKTKMMISATDTLSSEGLGPEGAILKEIQTRVDQIRSLSKGAAVDLKYDRRAAPPPPPPGVEARPSVFKKRSVQLTIAAFFLVTALGAAWNFFASRVSSSELRIGLAFTKAKLEEDGLTIYSSQEAWDRLPKEDIKAMLDNLEAYLKKEKARQCKIVDENGKLMAALIPGRVGRSLTLQQRIVRK
ncbi:MAG TPA: response regulator [Bdellovibrionota bacterium]|nr:response regulator [Bdellovibrionota bacterium]